MVYTFSDRLYVHAGAAMLSFSPAERDCLLVIEQLHRITCGDGAPLDRIHRELSLDRPTITEGKVKAYVTIFAKHRLVQVSELGLVSLTRRGVIVVGHIARLLGVGR